MFSLKNINSHKKNLIHSCGYTRTYCIDQQWQTKTRVRVFFDKFGNFCVGVFLYDSFFALLTHGYRYVVTHRRIPFFSSPFNRIDLQKCREKKKTDPTNVYMHRDMRTRENNGREQRIRVKINNSST